jgi:GNAT superfamily N-acetyltransferase
MIGTHIAMQVLELFVVDICPAIYLTQSIKVSKVDGRASALRLTDKGKAAFERLDASSEEQARTTLDNLSPDAAAELLHCMRTVQRLLTKDSPRGAVVLRPHRISDMGWVVHREAVGYAQQFGWDESFEVLVAKIVQDFIDNFDSAKERCWIAEVDGQNVGHIFLVRDRRHPGVAKLRLLFVEPASRGAGVGEALVRECVRFAHGVGYRKVVLWTQSILTAAHRIYQKAGFRLIKEEPHHSFGHDLKGQDWELDLATLPPLTPWAADSTRNSR